MQVVQSDEITKMHVTMSNIPMVWLMKRTSVIFVHTYTHIKQIVNCWAQIHVRNKVPSTKS